MRKIRRGFLSFAVLIGLLSASFSASAEEIGENEIIDDSFDGEIVVDETANDIIADYYEENPTNSDQEYINKSLLDGDYEVQEDGSVVVYDKRSTSGSVGIECIACVNGKWVLTKTGSSTVYGSWVKCTESYDKIGGRLTCSKSIGYSNSYTGTLSASKSAVEAVVGYNITKTGTTSTSYWVDVPKGKKYQIQYRRIYKKDIVKQQYYVGNSLAKTSYVYPQKFTHIGYRAISI